MLGDYGTGKSAMVRRVAYELAKRALAPQVGESEPVIPVFIDLKDQPNAISLENLLFKHFAQPSDSKGFNPAVLLYLLEAERIVLLLDSFDEMGLTAAGRPVEQQFRMLAYPAGKTPLAPGGNRVLISCRTHFFRDQQLVKSITDGPGDSLVSADSPLGRAARSFDAAIDELELFDDAQVSEFLRRHLGESAAAEMRRFITEGQYRFSHKSFLEYFYARRLLRAAGDGTLALLLDGPPPSPECADFLVDLARDGLNSDCRIRLFTPLRDILAAPYQPRLAENALRLLFDAARHWLGADKPFAEVGATLKDWLPQPLQLPGAQLAGFDLRGPLLAGRIWRGRC